MHTVTLEVADDYIEKFNRMIESIPCEKVSIKRDHIRDEIKKRVLAIKNGKEILTPYKDGMKELRDRLVSKYANT